MKRLSLYLSCCLYFLGLLYVAKAHTRGGGGYRPYRDVASTEQLPGAVRPWTGAGSEFMRDPPILPPYHIFPMFQHYPVPLVDMELFRPVSEKRHFPRLLTSLLIPPVSPPRIQVSPARNARGVEVWCGYSKVSVRLNKSLLGFRTSPSAFQLGTCPVSRFDNYFFYFHYDLNDCDSSLMMVNGQIVYSNTVYYTPEPQGTVIRAVPLTLNIQCLYNRFHYSYKMGFLPVVREHVFHKTFERKTMFSIFVCNERWERLEENGSFVLGEPMYFEVCAPHTSKNERIFVDSCYATASKDPKSTPKHSVISNYGCMEDSKREDSLSRFHQRESHIIRFSVDAFLLPQVTDTHFYLHCRVSVHNLVSATAKSCTYNNVEWRWEELYSDASVCDCCDSTCEIDADSYFPSMTQSLISSKPWILDYSQQSLINIKGGWVSVQGDTEKFKSAKGIDEEKDDDFTLEIVTDTEEQTETKTKNHKMSVMNLDEDVEVIVGRKETTATESKVKKGGHSGHVMSDGKEMGRVLKIGKDVGRPRSTSGAGVKGELLEDVKVSSKSGLNQLINITKDEIDLEDLQVHSTVPSQMVVDEELFLNAKQEPAEWNKDEH